MAKLTKTTLHFISVFTLITLLGDCSKDDGTNLQPQPQSPVAAIQNLKSEEKIYDHIVWDLYDAWGYSFEAHIIDAGAIAGRDQKRLLVQVWDDQKMDWYAPDKFSWYLIKDTIHIVNDSFDDSIRGTYARIKVIYF